VRLIRERGENRWPSQASSTSVRSRRYNDSLKGVTHIIAEVERVSS